MENVVWQTNFL